MKLIKLTFSLLFAVLISQTMTAQVQIDATIQKGSSYIINQTIEGQSWGIKLYPDAGGSLELINQDGKFYEYLYTPDINFEGDELFILQEVISYFPIPSFTDHIFTVSVVASQVTTTDDFVKFTEETGVTFDPLTNDESNASELSIKIAQVMHGAAIVNDDNTISYTPTDSDRDYIVYTGTDMYGTSSSSTVYLTRELEAPVKNTTEEVSIPSDSYEYISLPWSDYVLDDADLEVGSLEQINEYIYKYSSLEEANGEDEFTFTSATGLVHTVAVNVIAKDIDAGFVKDDVFFSASNTQLKFNVKENDLITQTVISDYSEELLHLGNGVFVYTPASGFSGSKTFSYTADTGAEEEEGTITIVVNNFEPITSINYGFAVVQDQPRVIEYNVPLGSEFFQIEDYPTNGAIKVYSDDESLDLACEEGIQKMIAVYTPNENYVGNDHISLRYCASDNNICKTVEIDLEIAATDLDGCICVDDCVWPGDANGDGNVNVRDVLSIGRNLGATGPVRAESIYGDIYEGANASAWSASQTNGTNLANADANGDGIITTDDLDYISSNYGKVNTIVAQDLFGVKNIPFGTINDTDVEVGELKTIAIFAGTEDLPAVDMHGIVFSMAYPANLMDPSTLEINFIEDTYFAKGAPFVSLTNSPAAGVMHAGGSKTNGLGSTGAGIIATVSFIVVEDADGIRPMKRNSGDGQNNFTLDFFDIVMEDAEGNKYSIPSTSAEFVINSEDKKEKSSYTAYPNPAGNKVTVASDGNNVINSIQVYNINGELMSTISEVGSKTTTVNTQSLNSGIYIMQINDTEGSQNIKLVKN